MPPPPWSVLVGTLACLVVVQQSIACRPPQCGATVLTEEGILRGQFVRGAGGAASYAAFRGIPYARAPVGDLRFKGPQPIEPWQGVRDATKEGAKCPQFTVPERQLVGEEDCLFLNVYTPGISAQELRAVMVYIHGGGFTYGSSSEEENGPDFLVNHGVVLVTMNYRIGALGFLNLDTDSVPGNMGLKDQNLALKWVQRNIIYFGGDPSRVTLFGNSAGAASTHLHTLVPASKGLFSAAILQSGNALANFAYSEDNLERAAALCKVLDSSSPCAPAAEVERVARAASMPAIINATLAITAIQLPFHASPERRAPREGAGGEPVFLHTDPESLVRSPIVDPVPTIAGVNEHEGLFLFYFVALNLQPQLTAALAQNVTAMLPRLTPFRDTAALLGLQHRPLLTTSEVNTFNTRLRREYKIDVTNVTEDQGPLIDFLGDVFTVMATHRLARLSKRTAFAPLWFYNFNMIGDYNWARKQFNMTQPGTSHTDELGHLMHITKPDLNQDLLAGTESSQALQLLTQMWTDFAKYGLPTPSEPACWPNANSEGAPFVWINSRLLPGTGPLGGSRMKIWDDILGSFRGGA